MGIDKNLNPLKINTRQFKTKNFRGVLSIMAGSTLSRVIAAIGGLTLANFYGPDSYGLYNVFLSYVLIIPVLASFRLDSVMIMQRGSREIRNLFSGILIISLVATLFIVSIIALLKLSGLVFSDLTYVLLLLIGLGSVLSVWNITQNNMFTKYKLFKQISNAFVISSLTAVVFQGIFYLLGLKQTGLIYGWMTGLVASFIYNILVAKSRFQKVDVAMFKKSVKENIKIIKYTYPSDSINAIANNIMPILIVLYFTERDVGLYAMAFKILSVPLIILSGAIARVYFQKAVSIFGFNNKGLQKLTYKIILINVAILMAYVLFMNTIGRWLFERFLNESWDGLNSFILALSFWIVARSAMNPVAALVVVLEKNEYSLFFNIWLLLVNFIGIWIGVWKGNLLYSIWVFSILSGLGYLFLLMMTLIELRKHVRAE